jgi:hypothetical protein
VSQRPRNLGGQWPSRRNIQNNSLSRIMDTEQHTAATSSVLWEKNCKCRERKDASLGRCTYFKNSFLFASCILHWSSFPLYRIKVCYFKANTTSDKYTAYRRMFQRISRITHSVRQAISK